MTAPTRRPHAAASAAKPRCTSCPGGLDREAPGDICWSCRRWRRITHPDDDQERTR